MKRYIRLCLLKRRLKKLNKSLRKNQAYYMRDEIPFTFYNWLDVEIESEITEVKAKIQDLQQAKWKSI